MTKKVCFIHTETTGLHEYQNEKIYKKNLYGYARMVSLSWIIASRTKGNEYEIEKKEKFIIKPRCMFIPEDTVQYHGITQEIAIKKGTEIDDVLDKFLNDIKSVGVIASHSLDFHFKTVLGEIIRYNKIIHIEKYIFIDINSFQHKISPSTLSNISKVVLKKDLKDKAMVIDTICQIFFKFYDDYEKSITVVK